MTAGGNEENASYCNIYKEPLRALKTQMTRIQVYREFWWLCRMLEFNECPFISSIQPGRVCGQPKHLTQLLSERASCRDGLMLSACREMVKLKHLRMLLRTDLYPYGLPEQYLMATWKLGWINKPSQIILYQCINLNKIYIIITFGGFFMHVCTRLRKM